MSIQPGEQAKLDAYSDVSPEPDAEPSGEDDGAARPVSAPDEQREQLAEIFENLTGDATFVEAQQETPSHAPIEGSEEVPDLSDDGLDDAADSDLNMGGWT